MTTRTLPASLVVPQEALWRPWLQIASEIKDSEAHANGHYETQQEHLRQAARIRKRALLLTLRDWIDSEIAALDGPPEQAAQAEPEPETPVRLGHNTTVADPLESLRESGRQWAQETGEAVYLVPRHEGREHTGRIAYLTLASQASAREVASGERINPA